MMTISDTSLTLLASLRDPADNDAWRRFDQRYRHLLVQFAQRVGLDHHEADEVAQQTLIAFSQAHRTGSYDRGKGKFRNWLLGIAQHKIADWCADRKKYPTPIGSPQATGRTFSSLNDPGRISAIWDREWEAFVMTECFRMAKTQFTQRDFRVFERLTLEQEKVEPVAIDLGMSREAVRQIRHRVLRYMRSVREELENAW
jgi:RNA polymerase sigma factor (sigma-70 family)